jgi:hypothetical protein
MATVPPADRTSPRLDPRYDPVFQRGYSSERTAEPRPFAPSPARRSTDPASSPRPAPPRALETETDSGTNLDPVDEQPDVAPPEAPPRSRPRTGLLWLVSAALVVAGVLLHFAFGAAGYGADWSVSTDGGAIRFADGRSVEQVLATQLAVAVAPQLVVLGIATAVATLFLHILRSERGTR